MFDNDYMSRIDRDSENVMWKQRARAGAIVEAIKEFRSNTGAGLKESKDVVEEYNRRNKLKIEAVAPKIVRLNQSCYLELTKSQISGNYTVRRVKEVGLFTEAQLFQVIADQTFAEISSNGNG